MRWLLIVAGIVAAYLWLGGNPNVGQLQPDSRYQYPGYTIVKLEPILMSGRILSTRGYNSGREAELSPLDIALGWEAMADAQTIAQLELSQRDRWLYWKAQRMPMPRDQLESSMANIPIIPENSRVAA